MTNYSRHQLADALQAALPVTYKVVPDPRSLGELDPSMSCYVQVVRQTIKNSPPNPIGDYWETFELWVIEATTDPDTAEDALDDKLTEVLGAIDEIGNWLRWRSADRRIHKSERHAYMITVETITEKEPTP